MIKITNIVLTVNGAVAMAKTSGVLTAGAVGIPVKISYDSSWDGLTKTAVFKSKIIRDQINIDDSAVVAPEVMLAGYNLYVGVEGRNADGTIVIPTVWANAGRIEQSASASGDESTNPDLPVWEQVLNKVGDLDLLHTDSKDSLVDSINEIHDEVEKIIDVFVATSNDEVIDDLIENDLLCAVTDKDASLLSDNGDVLIW